MDENQLPRWVRHHREYYGGRITIPQYRKFDEILCGEMGGTGELLLKAVDEMIRSCFKGYSEDMLKFFQNYIAKNAPPCDVCNGRGIVEVPNHGPRKKVAPRIGFLCFCAVGIRARGRYPDAATIGEYEDKHGKGWRAELPPDTRLPDETLVIEPGNMGEVFRSIVERIKKGGGHVVQAGWDTAFAGDLAVAAEGSAGSGQ
jgi:hypothetical protein